MILRTETYRELEEDLAKIMGIEELFLYQRLSEINRECLDGFNSDWDKYEEQIGNLISEYADLSVIDEVYIYHLGRHVIEPKKLLPLKEVLLSETKVSVFLKEHDIVFDEENGGLDFSTKGHKLQKKTFLQKNIFVYLLGDLVI